MLPIKLIVSAFGPYTKKSEIDLSLLSSNGIFLITGDTGSGKTTIFDAICFALYAVASGDVRDSSMFRSKYSKDDDVSYVELEFLCGEKKYVVKRTLEYMRKKKSGDGFTKQVGSAELILPDGSVITKNRDVNLKLIEIIGLDINQFRQICMIAQGDFLKLLLASTDERKKIFRDIFNTGYYEILQNKLKEDVSLCRNECDKLSASLFQYIDGIVSDESFFNDVELAKSNKMVMSDVISLVSNIIDFDKNTLVSLGEDIASQTNELVRITKKIDIFLEMKRINDNLSLLRDKKAEVDELLTSYLVKLDSAKLDGDGIDKLSKGVISLEESLDFYSDIDNLKKIIMEDEKVISSYRSTIDNLNLKKVEVMKNLELNNEDVLKFDNVAVKLESCFNTGVFLSGKAKEINECLSLFDDFKGFELEKIRALESYNCLCDDYDKALNLYNKSYRVYLDSQAGILASSLNTGKACPVCGSYEHPCKASVIDVFISEDGVNDLKKIADEFSIKVSDASLLSSNLNVKLENCRVSIIKFCKKLELDVEFDILFDKLCELNVETKGKISTNSKLFNELREDKEVYEKLSKSIDGYNKELVIINDELTSVSILLASLSAKNESNVLSLGEKSKKLVYSSLFEVKKVISDKNAEILLLKNNIIKYETLYNEQKGLDSEILGEIKGLESSLVEVDIDYENCILLKSSLIKKIDSLNVLKSEIDTRLVINNGILNKLSYNGALLDESLKKFSLVKSLADTANGTISGKEKVMIETFVQMNFFERILAVANTRLMVMTGGQYELIRKVVSGNLRQSGLDMDVIDHFNGSVRDVRTLSGGESFKASLSLALGLSDVVSSLAGGIRINVMFVDEGFGSLSSESLEMAIETLMNLSSDGKLIGIISHVFELKERIDKQIVVTKSVDSGSVIKIVN